MDATISTGRNGIEQSLGQIQGAFGARWASVEDSSCV
jgi:hypothetical protein